MLREIVTLDIETESILTGKGSVVPWEAKITDIGLCWGADFETETVCYGAEQVEAVIKSLSEKQTPLVPYNALFEVAMLDYHFPQYPLNWIGDCALCSIALDNSVEDFDLKTSAGRLVNYEPYHLEVMNYCVSTFNCGATKWGEHIPMLPSDMRQEYCRKDVHATYLIWQRACDELKLDVLMDCFMAEVFLTAEAYLCGTRIDREFATELMSERQGKIDSTRASFLSHPELVEHIEAVQESKFNKEVAKRLAKSKTGKTRPIDKEAWLAKNPFNPGSEQQLTGVFKSQKLFFDESTQTFRFPATTPTGAPQLDVAHIHLYGVGGQILAEAGEIETERNKLRTILEDSEYDGRAHFNVNLCTVRSTRVSSSGLNIVATPLDGDIGKTFIADDGYTFFGLDFVALEPTVQAIVSGDPSLKYCVFDGEGVKPYYDQDLLKIDDVYLTVGSVSELYGEFIRKNINPDDWMADKEAVKYAFKKQRQILKIITLMTLYGSGIENVVSLVAKLAKVQITFKQGQSLVNALWSAFPGLYSFNVRLQNQARRQGHITTCMGFKIMTPDNVVHCILNYLCQTTAAHVMKMFLYQLHLRVQRDYKWARPAVVDVHDATFWMVKEERVPDFRIICEESLNDMNETFKFPINFRFSASIGKTLYHGKGGH